MKILAEYIRKIINAIKDGTAKSFLEETGWVYSYIRRYWKSMILYTVVGMVNTVVSIAATYISRDLVDIITGHKTGAVIKYFVLMILSTRDSLPQTSKLYHSGKGLLITTSRLLKNANTCFGWLFVGL